MQKRWALNEGESTIAQHYALLRNYAKVILESNDGSTVKVGEDLDLSTGNGLTLMSNQHKGLIETVKDVMPYVGHHQCARHIYKEFRKKVSGVQFRGLFLAASKASYPELFKKRDNHVIAMSRCLQKDNACSLVSTASTSVSIGSRVSTIS
ncbi:hypothetical protein Tco_1358276, partial [Tanacetum coccineum]